MKILFLTSRFPFPPHRGDKLHVFNLIKNLSQSHEIVLLSFCQSRKEVAFIPQIAQYCVEVKCIEHPLWKSLMQCLVHVFSRTPFQVSYFASARMHRELDRMLARHNFQVIHTHLIRMAQYALTDRGIPRVLDLTDAVSLYLSRFLRSEVNPLKRILLKLELRRIRRYEQNIAKFDRSSVCSEVDRRALMDEVPSARIEIVENGVDTTGFLPTQNGGGERDTIMFAGNLSYYPNQDGVSYFIRDIFPMIQERVPSARLIVVGNNPPGSLRRLRARNVTITGYVTDIRSYYLRATVAVSPIRFGAGTPYKVLDAMALGVPVVATPIGTEGLHALSGEHLFIAGGPEEFASRVVELLTNYSLRARLANNARKLVVSKYDCQVVAKKLDSLYSTVIEERHLESAQSHN